MKKITVLAFFVVFSTIIFGQSISNKEKIIQFLGEEKFSSTLESNPGKIKFLSAYESDGYSVETLPLDKKIDLAIL